MRRNNAGFSLIEVLVAIAVLAAVVIPVCSSMVLSVSVNAKAEAVLQARTAVSSAVETLMTQGITGESDAYDRVGDADLFPGVTVETAKQDPDDETPAYYIVEVADDNQLVTITTKIRAVEPQTDEEGGAQ